MESSHILDTESAVDIFCLHHCFTHLIQQELDLLRKSWNCNRIRTCRNQTLNRMYYSGLDKLAQCSNESGEYFTELDQVIKTKKTYGFIVKGSSSFLCCILGFIAICCRHSFARKWQKRWIRRSWNPWMLRRFSRFYGRSSKFCSFKFSHFIYYQAERHSFLHRNKVFDSRLCFWIFVVINIRNDLVNMYFNVYLRYNRQDNITKVFLKCFLLIFIVFINNNCQDDRAICWQANTQEPHYTWMEFSFKYGSILKFYCSQIFRNWKIKKVCENKVGFKILR